MGTRLQLSWLSPCAESMCSALVGQGVVPLLMGLTRLEEPEEVCVHALIDGFVRAYYMYMCTVGLCMQIVEPGEVWAGFIW